MPYYVYLNRITLLLITLLFHVAPVCYGVNDMWYVCGRSVGVAILLLSKILLWGSNNHSQMDWRRSVTFQVPRFRLRTVPASCRW